MKNVTELLLDSGFFNSPNTYFCSFDGEFKKDIDRFSNNRTKPVNGNMRFEGINPTEWGYEVVFDHGKLCPPSFLRFPRFANESDFTGCFARLNEWLSANYEWEAGLPAGVWGD